MVTSKDLQDKAIGYIRVSTEMQAVEDVSLGQQVDRIRECCQRRGVALLEVYEDVASAASVDGFARRDGLCSAVRRAHEEEAMLIVAEPTRLFRNVADVGNWLATVNVPVFSVAHGRILGRRALVSAAVGLLVL